MLQSILKTKLFAALLISLVATALFALPASAQSKGKDKDKKGNTLTFNGKQTYVHTCPAGTEPIGKAPPEGTEMHCRQPVTGGFRRHGAFVTWYDNGQKRIEGEYQRDKKHGIWTIYNRDGTKKYVEEYYNGQTKNKTAFNRWGEPVDDQERKNALEKRRESQSWKYEKDGEKTGPKKRSKKYSWVKKSSSNGAKRMSWVKERKNQRKSKMSWVSK